MSQFECERLYGASYRGWFESTDAHYYRVKGQLDRVKVYRCYRPDHGEQIDDAFHVAARDPKQAAAVYAEHRYAHNDYPCEQEIRVREGLDGAGIEFEFTVEAQTEVFFSASERPLCPDCNTYYTGSWASHKRLHVLRPEWGSECEINQRRRKEERAARKKRAEQNGPSVANAVAVGGGAK